ncbi:membrane protein YpdK [Chimaeribacter arupi]|uniref:Membrane protein YpdK n=1 Tax=Chimaeribacter arupi TaxID=2060066 RepID=A0A2N5EQ67_9GAMM|nr:membrane protein YpdK [Chimaeribacter arupi]PLR50049.1 membrane protein YpdK [Chimaeribacter arupi]PLR50576.1 membrane protein YpdK [Chimaeribacter arupi]PLR51561.1 membrane protein YpdK [Chimaeribacter arupi]
MKYFVMGVSFMMAVWLGAFTMLMR